MRDFSPRDTLAPSKTSPERFMHNYLSLQASLSSCTHALSALPFMWTHQTPGEGMDSSTSTCCTHFLGELPPLVPLHRQSNLTLTREISVFIQPERLKYSRTLLYLLKPTKNGFLNAQTISSKFNDLWRSLAGLNGSLFTLV